MTKKELPRPPYFLNLTHRARMTVMTNLLPATAGSPVRQHTARRKRRLRIVLPETTHQPSDGRACVLVEVSGDCGPVVPRNRHIVDDAQAPTWGMEDKGTL